MFLRGDHIDGSIPEFRQLIRENSLGVLTTAIRSDTHPLIQVSHIPFLLDIKDEANTSELGTLRGHIAKQNPQSKAMMAAADAASSQVLEEEVLVLFTHHAHHYVTPKFYTETKPTTARVVPTWNYAAVQVYGKAKIYYDSKAPETGAFLSAAVDDLSSHSEKNIMGFTGKGDAPGPWKVSDAPENYVEMLKKNIIGIEIEITRMDGKFKMSQEMQLGDRQGVVKGFKGLGTDVAGEVSRIVEKRSEMKEARRAAKAAA